MPEQVELFDSLFAKIKQILGQCEDTVKEQVEGILVIANKVAKTATEQVNNIHTSIDEFATKLEKAEETTEELVGRLALELNLEIAVLQAEVQKLLDQLKGPTTVATQSTKCCCNKPC